MLLWLRLFIPFRHYPIEDKHKSDRQLCTRNIVITFLCFFWIRNRMGGLYLLVYSCLFKQLKIKTLLTYFFFVINLRRDLSITSSQNMQTFPWYHLFWKWTLKTKTKLSFGKKGSENAEWRLWNLAALILYERENVVKANMKSR